MENWHFRSFNGSWTPKKSPFKIQLKIIKKPTKPISRYLRTIWRVNHQAAIREVFPKMKKPRKELTEMQVAKIKGEVFKWCRPRSMQMYLKSCSIYRK